MQETTAETIVLEEPGPSAHLVLRGVVGAQEATYTDEDLRAATTGDLAIARKLNSQRFVTVDASGLGRLDRTHTVRFDIPVITDLPASRGRARPHSPAREAEPGPQVAGAHRSDVASEEFSTGRFELGPDTHTDSVGVWS